MKPSSDTSTKGIISYSAISFPLSIMAITYYVLLPKWYAEVHGIELVRIGIWLAVSRIWDAVSDPLCGMVSDALSTYGIHRKIIIRIGVILLVSSFFILLNPDFITSDSPQLVFIVFSFIFYTGMTLVSVPYEALAIEMESNSQKRTRLIGGRDALLVLGTLGAALLPLFFRLESESGRSTTDLYSLSFLYIGFVTVGLLFLEYWLGKSISDRAENKSNNTESLKEFWHTLKGNAPFIKLLSAFVVNALGAALPAALFLFFVEYRLQETEEKAYLALFAYFGIGFLTLPFWLYLTKKIKKKSVWFLAQFINAGSFLPVAFLGAGDYPAFLVLVSLSALGFGGITVLPSILQADIIEHTKKKSGTKIEGGYVGIWSVAKKLSQATGAGVGIYLLGLSGFTPGETTGETSKLMLSVLYAVIPSCTSILSIFIAWNLEYDENLTRTSHEEIGTAPITQT